MIEMNKNNDILFDDFFSKKMTLLFQDDSVNNQEDITNFLKTINENKYYGIVGRENNMIPFLSILDNLLLGITKKEKREFTQRLDLFLDQFKLSSLDLKQVALNLSKNEQLVLQMIRALILNQTIVLVDSSTEEKDSSRFLVNIMPVLKRQVQEHQATIIISSQNRSVAESPYYDQCVLLKNINS